MMTISHYIVSLVGIGYTIVGIQQYVKGNIGSGIMWLGYGFSQIGLFMQLEK
jgi:PPE-repeat protein